MAQVHAGHTATLLNDGKVLVVGGGTKAAELYDPLAGTWSGGGTLSINRIGHTATLLGNGKVLVVGGGTPEVYDPQTNAWSLVAPLTTDRTLHTASLLADGRVLIAGGVTASNSALKSTEIYNPTTNQWQAGANLNAARESHTATSLANGKILVAGGQDSVSFATVLRSTEIYDPATGLWTSSGLMPVAHSGHRANPLANGNVLISEGINFCDNEFGFCNSFPVAELFNATTQTWSKAGLPLQARIGATATLLPNQKVMVTGGTNSDQGFIPFPTTEFYIP
jgi:N-acetylneuraminic acid mutarotase